MANKHGTTRIKSSRGLGVGPRQGTPKASPAPARSTRKPPSRWQQVGRGGQGPFPRGKAGRKMSRAIGRQGPTLS